MIAITSKDIQPKNVRTDSNPNNDNKIRKAWLLQLPESTKAKIKTKLKTSEVRWSYYDAIDTSVNDKWIEIMRKHFADSIAAGAKLVVDKAGAERLEDAYCVDTDEQLIEAAFIIVNEIIDEMA